MMFSSVGITLFLLQLASATCSPIKNIKNREENLANNYSVYFDGNNDEIRLISHLMANYQGRGLGRPVVDIREPMDIYFRMQVDEFSELNEQLGTVRIVTTVRAMWRDEFLRWNASQFGGIDALYLDVNRIYVPVILPIGRGMHNAPIFHEDVTISKSTPFLWTDNNGIIHAAKKQTLETSCKVDLSKFPMDTQHCQFYFKVLQLRRARSKLRIMSRSLSHSNAELGDEASEEETVEDEDDDNNSESHSTDSQMWHLVGNKGVETTVRTSGGLSFSAIVYTVSVERKADYYLWQILLPTASMALVQTSIFFLPFSPERIMYSITAVLTINIFQSSLSAKMNIASEPVPLVKYSTAQLIMGILITIESVIALMIIKQTKTLPRWLVKTVEILNGDNDDDDDDDLAEGPIPPLRGSDKQFELNIILANRVDVAPNSNTALNDQNQIKMISEEPDENQGAMSGDATPVHNLISLPTMTLAEPNLFSASNSRKSSLRNSQMTLNTIDSAGRARRRRKHKAGRSRLLEAQQWSATRMVAFAPQPEVAISNDETTIPEIAEETDMTVNSELGVQSEGIAEEQSQKGVAAQQPGFPTLLKSALSPEHRHSVTSAYSKSQQASSVSENQPAMEDNLIERFELAALMDRIGLAINIIFFLAIPLIFFRLAN